VTAAAQQEQRQVAPTNDDTDADPWLPGSRGIRRQIDRDIADAPEAPG
jgi:hypothetical protein